MNTNPIKTIILMFLVALLGFGCARIQRSDVKRPSRPPARTATAPVSDLLYSDGEEKIQLLSATLSKNRLPEGSSKISIRCSTSPELGVNNISLVLILEVVSPYMCKFKNLQWAYPPNSHFAT